MKIARIRYDECVHLARIESGTAILLQQESDHPAADVLREALAAGVNLQTADGTAVSLTDCDLLAPVSNPSKFLGVGLNYADHAAESGMELPSEPTLFVKTTNSIIGPGDTIVLDSGTSAEVDFEVELAFVVGRRARDVSEGSADEYLLGYTICNDVTARDAQFSDGQWTRSKSFDTFAPIGPWIVSTADVDIDDIRLTTRINDELLQDGSTSELVFSPSQLVAYITQFMTLEAGDVITTGTPPGVGFARTPPRFLTSGDEIVMEVEGIGVLRNNARNRPDRGVS